VTQDTRDSCLELVEPARRYSLAKYLDNPRLGGVAVILGCAGSGKTDMLCAVAAMFLFSQDNGRVYAAAPTNTRVSSFAKRCHDMVSRMVQKFPVNHSRRYLPFILRGYPLEEETTAFVNFSHCPWVPQTKWDIVASGEERQKYRPTSREYRLSPAFWLWVALKMPRDDTVLPLCPRLVAIRESFHSDPNYKVVRDYVDNKTPLSSINDTGPGSTTTLVAGLLGRVILAADMVCTTPHDARGKDYAAFNKTTKGVVLDEAGAMARADVFPVWTEGCRCVMTGNEMHEASILGRLKQGGWPCLVIGSEYSGARSLVNSWQ